MIDWPALPASYSKGVTFFGVGRKGEGVVMPNLESLPSIGVRIVEFIAARVLPSA